MRSKFVVAVLALVMIVALTITIFSQVFASDLLKAKTESAAKSAQTSVKVTPVSTAPVIKTTPPSSVARTTTFVAEDTVVGTGAVVTKGSTVTIHYKGMLTDGTIFDSSYARNQPFSTQIGVGRVIKGWDEGIIGMKVGGKRKLTIAPEYGYGSQANQAIPANSTLIFETELLEVK